MGGDSPILWGRIYDDIRGEARDQLKDLPFLGTAWDVFDGLTDATSSKVVYPVIRAIENNEIRRQGIY